MTAESANPLLADWTTPFEIPPFEQIGVAHFRPAFEIAIAEWRGQIEAIATSQEPPSFANTIEALELSGQRLERVSAVFFNLCSSDTSPELQEIEAEISPELARHGVEIRTDARLFARIEALHEQADTLGLDTEQRRVLDLYREDGVRAGARLDDAGRARMSAIMQRLAALGAEFSRRVLADEADFALELDAEDLAGLPKGVCDAMAQAAEARGKPGRYVVTTSRSSIEPFLQFSERRDLREAAWRGFVARGAWREETATAEIVAETLKLRQERAHLLGFGSFAAYKLDNQMAKTPGNVRGLLERVWERARAKAEREAETLQASIREAGGNFDLAPWDWPFYSEKLRRRELDLDDAEIKPYLQLDAMIEAAFDTANRLFGLSFYPLPDAPRHHPDARVWEVRDRAGKHLGVFFGDYFARPSKRSGAWMSGFRSQRKLGGELRPLIVNTMNFNKPAEGCPALLTFEDARTLFHEFGHALHGLMSDVTFDRISGTSVPRDWVELPSQLYEHWLMRDEVLGKYARHAETGEALPAELIARARRAQTWNRGCETVEYLASALVDLELHEADIGAGFDPLAFQEAVLDRIGLPDAIVMRHHVPHFGHVFSGDGYSAGYYSYMWSEVMDADAFGAFEEAGDVFDAEIASRLAEHVYSSGGRDDPEDAYTAFRGRAPEPEALFRRRGLTETETGAA